MDSPLILGEKSVSKMLFSNNLHGEGVKNAKKHPPGIELPEKSKNKKSQETLKTQTKKKKRKIHNIARN